ncbi:MAG: ABC transporter substrate-binding protein [Deltaproteobacteria bacterium]|nr:MAG: ABC transporter substrate-binding protein [Deltaproteobacteria bacterium]TMQ26892.1 MAG: ABC transporter substrate-binding protein [Deltaproteobacteria bacterium]
MQRAALSCVVVLATALGCDALPRSLHHRRDPRALVVAQAADVTGLDLARVLDNESVEVGQIVFEGLVRWRPETIDIEPGLAIAWQVSADGLHWVFTLRPGVVFHDGTPLDAAAVVFSFERVLDPHHPSYLAGDDAQYWRGLLKDIVRVTALGPTLVEIDVARPYAPLLGELAAFPIVSPAAVRRWGDDFMRHPVGTGAFAFEAWDPGDEVVVARFAGYWGPPPPLERIVFRVVIDARQRLVDLQSGSVDLAAGILPDEQAFVELHPDLALHHAASNDISYLAFNLTHPPFDDIRVRRAISHAINKVPIVKLAYQGRASAADSALSPGQLGYHLPATRYAYDPARARQLLAEAAAAGAFDPARTYRLYAPTTPRAYLPAPERVAHYLEAALAQVGVRIELILQPLPGHLAAIRRSEHDLALFGWIGDTGDPDNVLYVLLHSDNAVPGSTHNIAFYKNPEVDRLLVAAQAPIDPASRDRLYAQVQDRVAEDAPWVPIAHSEVVIAARAELDHVVVSPLGHPLYTLIRRKEPR